MTPHEYQKAVERTTPDSYPYLEHSIDIQRHILHAQLGLTTELGEITDTLKKHFIYKQPLDIGNLEEEIGDVMWYLALLTNALELSLSICMERNIDKLKVRYPEKFTTDLAKERLDKK